MPLKKLPYKTISSLIKKHLSETEDETTAKLISRLKVARQRKYLIKSELIDICHWKSPRAIHWINKNSPYSIKTCTEKAFSTKSEREKIASLTKLKGVSIPMASSILMLMNPKRYGVIDIRVWELFYEYKIMTTNSRGVNFRFNEWYRYLVIIRFFAKKFAVTARDLERTLFNAHQKYQEGNLYDNLLKKSA